MTLAAAILAMMGAHVLALLQARGAPLATAVALGMLIGPFAVGARFIETFAGRRYHPIWTMIASSILVALGTLLLYGGLTSLGVGVALGATVFDRIEPALEGAAPSRAAPCRSRCSAPLATRH